MRTLPGYLSDTRCPLTGQTERSDREIEEEVFDEDNMLESKTTQDHYLSLWPIKRLKSHLLFREEPQE